MEKLFAFGMEVQDNNFVGREREVSRLLSAVQQGINVGIIAPRRLGKTSLAHRVGRMVQSDKLKVVYVDLFSCRSEDEFYEIFASAVLEQTSSNRYDWKTEAKKYLFNLSSKITIGSKPLFEISIFMEKDVRFEEVLNLPEKIAQQKGCNILVCIDDFQQVEDLKMASKFFKKLQKVWQSQKSVSYCVIGNDTPWMSEQFEGKGGAFSKFGDIVHLSQIEVDEWEKYIRFQFASTGKSISRELVEKICQVAENNPFYIQQLAWMVWVYTETVATESTVKEAIQDILEHNTPFYKKQIEGLSFYQMNFLRAIVEGVHKEFTTQEILQKYQLSSSANVSIVKRALSKKELIRIEKQQIYISDPILAMWLKRLFV